MCNDIADVVFALDISHRYENKDNWQTVLSYLNEAVTEFKLSPYNTQIGLLTYGNLATIEFHLNQFYQYDEMAGHILSIPWKEHDRNISGGIRVMNDIMFKVAHGDRPLAPNVGVIITTGSSTRDFRLTVPYAAKARHNNITLIAVAIGDGVDSDEMIGITGNESLILERKGFKKLGQIFSQLIRYVLRFHQCWVFK